ncbi:hypothetical protein HYQ46_008839 [Verticillium longisporum]|nr:hypothetical protein HYQ46_008839 [Verticillium longisporum]
MLVHASESADVPANVRGTLEAAHDAIGSFFLLFSLFELEARVWWVFNHRAFLEALCIGSVIREAAKRPGGRMIEIMKIMGDGEQGSDVARTRVVVLEEFL